ncbi:hypothetical protein H1Q63_15820 [Desmonostoc muscorum CCALA 125]|nr:hypothetical protein [Desmonostoc muscorum CCALA 125]
MAREKSQNGSIPSFSKLCGASVLLLLITPKVMFDSYSQGASATVYLLHLSMSLRFPQSISLRRFSIANRTAYLNAVIFLQTRGESNSNP